MRQTICRRLLRLGGWEVVGAAPNIPKCVVIAAPHTSNWDLLLMLLMACAFGIRISWMGKAELFRSPFGPLLRRLGGLPVRRDTSHNMVDQMVERFATSDRLLLSIPPEGTRGRVEHWRSGFYHIAREANVPIAPSYLDYGHKVAGFGPAVMPTGDISADMDRIRAVYRNVVGKYPTRQGPIRLAEETGNEPPDERAQ